jgi:hypothetical protein
VAAALGAGWRCDQLGAGGVVAANLAAVEELEAAWQPRGAGQPAGECVAG